MLSTEFYFPILLVQHRLVCLSYSQMPIIRLPWILDLEDARQDGVKSCLGFHQQLIQSRLTQTLGLDAGLQSTVNSVLEQSTLQVLHHFAHARAQPAADPGQQSAIQNGGTSFSASQLQNYCACLEFVDANPSHPLYPSEQAVPSTWWLTSCDASGFLHLPTINDEFLPGLISADTSFFLSTLPPNDGPFVEPPQDIWDLSQDATEDLAVFPFEQQDFQG